MKINLIEEERVLLVIKVEKLRKAQFKAAAQLLGQSMSSLIHGFMTDTIREESKNDPTQFKQLVDMYLKEEVEEELIKPGQRRKKTRTSKSTKAQSKRNQPR